MRCTQCGAYCDDTNNPEAPLCDTCHERIYPDLNPHLQFEMPVETVNGMTMHEAIKQLVDAEMALAQYLDTLNLPNLIDSPGAQHAYLSDLYEALAPVVCLEAEASGNHELVEQYGFDDLCGAGFPWSDDEPDINDDFPMSVEYDGLWGASDFAIEQAAQDEARYEADHGF